MIITICEDEQSLGQAAAEKITRLLNDAIMLKGRANLLMSTGASQFSTIAALIDSDVDWGKVTMFHLDEYVGLPETHPASFRKYLKERFATKVPLGRAVYIDGEGDVGESIRILNEEISRRPIDIGIIGIGENAHIAFNDPPADFNAIGAFHVVELSEDCKRQQVNEKWFASVNDVPERAISITPGQIMKCGGIVSPVPGIRKANAIRATLNAERTDPNIPATLLKEHSDFYLFLDEESARGVREMH